MYWWETEKYESSEVIPEALEDVAGPNDLACVRLWPNGKTDPGWGMSPDRKGRTFMENYRSNKFNQQIAMLGLLSGRWAFAFVMRSMSAVCIDIDGKNGGMQNIGKLGMLPPTLAETSKSGDGYHLFYATPWDVWDEDKGFAMFKDRIGIVPGVDIRAVGCVFHHGVQRWNTRTLAWLPDFQKDSWLAKAKKQDEEIDAIIELLNAGDPDEMLMMQKSLVDDLKKTIPAGRRNTTLYAIGVKMLLAGVPDWEDMITAKGLKLGLDGTEVKKIISNAKKYR